MRYKVTAEITFTHGSLLPAQVVMPIEFEVEHWEDTMLMLFANEQFQSAEDSGTLNDDNIVSIKFTFSDGQ
jgi:hypothetical protein